MGLFTNLWKGIVLCLIIAIPSWYLGEMYPIVGGPVIAILLGIVLSQIIKNKIPFYGGILFTSKKILQYAVVLLGFGLNLNVVLHTGKQSLPIILSTITVSLIVAFILHKLLKLSGNLSVLIGVGSSICGGSAIAATAPVIKADNDDIAHSISVIFLFNVIAAIIFPTIGLFLGFDTTSGNAFGIFAGTAVNDTSSVTAAASTWDIMHALGTQTLDKAVTVKLTRTLAIIPITFLLALYNGRKEKSENGFSLRSSFPMFIVYFLIASLITTVSVSLGAPIEIFNPLKTLSKFFIILAMSAIGLNTNIHRIIKSGYKPILLGFACWISITLVTIVLQYLLRIW